MFRTIDDRYCVAAQITVDDVAQAAAAGFTLIINNRPDGEEPGAAQGDEISAAARQTGLDYVAIPVGASGFAQSQIDALDTALRAATGPVLAYCRSGTRSTYLWALTRAAAGEAPDMLCAKAQSAGYDLSAIRQMMTSVAPATGVSESPAR